MAALGDCTTQDIERLRPLINRLALDFYELQRIKTLELDIRDHAIVLHGALNIVKVSSNAATRKNFSSRFVHSVTRAMRLVRMFNLGPAPSQ
jgi:hypothetical protein